MREEDIPKYRMMSDKKLREEIPNWDWFKNLKPGDKAAIMIDDCIVPGINNCIIPEVTEMPIYIPVEVNRVNKDGSVEVYRYPFRFYYCRYPNEMDATIGLVPPRYAEETEEA